MLRSRMRSMRKREVSRNNSDSTIDDNKPLLFQGRLVRYSGGL